MTDEARKGLLGKGAILAVTSNADRTSPVVRGKWILDNLLGMPPPSPPANVPPLVPSRPATGRPRVDARADGRAPRQPGVRQLPQADGPDRPGARELRRRSAAGGRTDAAGPIDATGDLLDGTHVDGVVQLRQALLKRPEVFVGTMTEKLLTYALERGVEAPDMPTVRGDRAATRAAELQVLVARAGRREEPGVSDAVEGQGERSVPRPARRRRTSRSHGVQLEEDADAMYVRKMQLAAPDVPPWYGRGGGAAAARRDGAVLHRAGEDGGEPAAALRCGLHPARRHHGALHADHRPAPASTSRRS